jgi:CheY-like chemotaxis protein
VLVKVCEKRLCSCVAVWMAVMDGFEATKRIREKEAQQREDCSERTKQRALPIVALTASATKVSRS